ncbi:MAG: hypothetical protein EBZ47_09720, partial [Chlamydiae bacterium]|nr:hypothetical protein [Chlamydiota bacterium]
MVTKEQFVKAVSSGRGRKTKYEAEKHIGLLYDTFIVGEAISAFCAEALISQSTFFKWKQDYPEFKEAYDIAINFAENFWNKLPSNTADFNFNYWHINMRNRFGFGKPRLYFDKNADPLQMFETIKEALADQEISIQDAVQLATIAKNEADIKKGVIEDKAVSEQMSI